VAGSYKNNVDIFIKQMQLNHLSIKEREYYKPLIIEYIIKAMKNIIKEYIDFEIDIDMKDECETILFLDSNKMTSYICKAMKIIFMLSVLTSTAESMYNLKYPYSKIDVFTKKLPSFE